MLKYKKKIGVPQESNLEPLRKDIFSQDINMTNIISLVLPNIISLEVGRQNEIWCNLQRTRKEWKVL